VDLRRIEYAKKIADILAGAKNNVLLDSSILNLNLAPSNPKK
jgi:hypothetical protein